MVGRSTGSTGLKEAAVSGFRWSAAQSVAVALLQIVQLTVLGRLLGPEAFGLMAIVMIVAGFATIFSNAGIPEYVIQSEEFDDGDLSTLYWLNLLMGGLLYGLTFLAAPWIALLYDAPVLIPLLRVAALSFVVVALATVFRALCQRELDFRGIAYVDTAAAALTLIVSVVCATALALGVWSLVWGYLAGVALRSVATLWIARRLTFRPHRSFRRAALRSFFGFGFNRMGAMALNFFRSRVDQLLVGLLFGTPMLGFYSMAINLALQPVQRLNPALTQVAFPVFARIRDDEALLKRSYLRLVQLVSTLNSPALIGAAVVSPVAVPLLLGAHWAPMVPIVQGLVLYGLLRSIVSTGGNVILAKGRADWTFRWNLAMFFVNPLVVLLAGWKGDAVTIAVALSTLQVVLVVVHYRLIMSRLLGGFFKQYAQAVLVPIGVAAAMGIGVVIVGRMFATLAPVPFLALQVFVGVSLYSVLTLLFQRDMVRQLRASIAGAAFPSATHASG